MLHVRRHRQGAVGDAVGAAQAAQTAPRTDEVRLGHAQAANEAAVPQ